MGKETLKSNRLGGLFDGKTRHQAGSLWDIRYIAPTIDTMAGGYREPLIIRKKNNDRN